MKTLNKLLLPLFFTSTCALFSAEQNIKTIPCKDFADAILWMRSDRSDCLEKLLKINLHYISTQNINGTTLLHQALHINPNAFELIISMDKENINTNINLTDQYQNSLLHWAVTYGKYKILHSLIQAGAKITTKNSADLTPLDFAKNKQAQFIEEYNLNERIIKAIDTNNIPSLQEAIANNLTTQEIIEEYCVNKYMIEILTPNTKTDHNI